MKSIYLILIFIIFSICGFSQDYYVTTGGTDAASCGTIGSPCSSIQGVFDNNPDVTAGEIIDVGAGTYSTTQENDIIPGAGDTGFIIQGAGSSLTIIQPDQTGGNKGVFIFGGNCGDITIKNLQIKNSIIEDVDVAVEANGGGINFFPTQDATLTVENVIFDNCNAIGTPDSEGQGGSIYIDNEPGVNDWDVNLNATNCVFKNGSASVGGGIFLEKKNNATLSTISKCEFFNLTATDASYGGSAISNTTGHVRAENCLFYNNVNNGGIGVILSIAFTDDYFTLVNSTMADNYDNVGSNDCGFETGGTGRGSVYNCIFYNNEGSDVTGFNHDLMYTLCDGDPAGSGSTTGSNFTGPNPNFVGGSDYHLTASSTLAIDNGDGDTPPTDDLESNARVLNDEDMGCYEFAAGCDLVWDGSSGSDWATAANWDGNAIPTSTCSVTITTAGTAPIISAADVAVCESIKVDNGATLTASMTAGGGGSFAIWGDINIAGTGKIAGVGLDKNIELHGVGKILTGSATDAFTSGAQDITFEQTAGDMTLASDVTVDNLTTTVGTFSLGAGAGPYTLVVKDLTLTGGAFDQGDGTVKISGDLIRETGGTFTASTGTTEFNGTAQQDVNITSDINTAPANDIVFNIVDINGSDVRFYSVVSDYKITINGVFDIKSGKTFKCIER